jgi:hypothetical protein
VVEVENDWVGLAAVHTRMVKQIVEDLLRELLAHAFVASLDHCVVTGLVLGMPTAVAFPAVPLPTVGRGRASVESFKGQPVLAA